jgi:hypothetical protein
MVKLLGILFLFSIHANAGGLVGNGGHSVFCKSDPQNRFHGFYDKDYLFSFSADSGFSDDDLRPVTSWESSLREIGAVMSRFLPELTPSFENFRSYAFHKPDGKVIQGQVRWWVGVEEELQTVFSKTEFYPDVFPPDNCLIVGPDFQGPGEIRVPFLYQAIVRTVLLDTKDAKLTLYRYAPKILEQLDQMNISFLLVHEWLWDLAQSPEVVRKVNRFLHSKEFMRLRRDQILLRLRELGLEIKV